MPGMAIDALPPIEEPAHEPSGDGGPDHPMRVMTRRAAGLTGEPWDDEARTLVASLFDALAPTWHTRDSPERQLVVEDALARGEVQGRGALEVASGTGAYTARIGRRFDHVVSLDLSSEMLRLATGDRVLADAAAVPLADGSVDTAVLVNAFLFPAEIDRVLAVNGCVVWVNTSGDRTPIYLPTEDVAAALPGEWSGVESRHGSGTWCVLRRS